METEEQGSGGSGADTSTSSDSFILPRRRGRKLGRMTYLDFGKVLKFSLSWTPTSFVSWGVILDHLIELKGRSLVCIRCDTGSPWV